MHEAEATTEWGRGRGRCQPLWGRGRGRGHIIWPRDRIDFEALTSLELRSYVVRSTIGYHNNSWASCLSLSTVVIVRPEVTAPSHEIALVGSRLSLTCWSNSSKDICWEYYPNYESIPRTIYTGRYVISEYSRTHTVTVSSDGNVTVSLTLMEVRLEDAGIYQCRECSTVQSADIEVIVLGMQFWISSSKQSTR